MGWLDGKEKKENKETPDAPAASNDASQQEEFLNKLRLSISEEIKPMREKLETYEQRFSTLEEQTRKPAPRIENNEIPSVMDGDEDGAFRARLAPLAGAISAITGQLAEDRVVADITSQGWGELVPELRKTLATIALQYKADAQYETSVRKIAYGMIGEAALKGGVKRDPDKKTFFLEDSSGGATLDKGMRISSEDQHVMDRLGIKNQDAFLKSVRPS